MEDFVSQTKAAIIANKERALRTFSQVPDDKLDWSPTPTCKSALRIAAHIGVSGHGMAGVISGGSIPKVSVEEFFAIVDNEERAITTREGAVQAIETSTEELVKALDSLTPDKLNTILELPFGSMPMSVFISIIPGHIGNHAGQIDYVQTAYGDMVPYF